MRYINKKQDLSNDYNSTDVQLNFQLNFDIIAVLPHLLQKEFLPLVLKWILNYICRSDFSIDQHNPTVSDS